PHRGHGQEAARPDELGRPRHRRDRLLAVLVTKGRPETGGPSPFPHSSESAHRDRREAARPSEPPRAPLTAVEEDAGGAEVGEETQERGAPVLALVCATGGVGPVVPAARRDAAV